jgi:REP element-mobilizing transposase RayT
MTIARRILPHTSWLITRRCSERRFFLLPNSHTRQVFEYALARAARITGVALHAWMVMSNHYHLVVTDLQGRLPEFLRLLNSLVARALNFRYRRKEAFWKPGSYNAVQLCSDAAVLDKMVYTLANPVMAGLVRRAWSWEGSSSVGMDFGGVRRVLRPGFSKSGEDVETLRLVAPPSNVSSAAEIAEAVRRGLHARENEVRDRFAGEGRRFVGMRAVLAQSWESSARSEEAFGGMVPCFATRDVEELRRVIREWKEWVADYRRALGAFRDGVRDAVFPAGTYLMKERFGVVVAER